MADYFAGERDVLHIELSAKSGKVRLACRVFEHWVPIYQEVLRCGATSTCRLKRRLGVKDEERIGFEEKLGTSIGPKAIGTIKAQIQNSLSSSRVWEAENESERSVTFTSPICGRYNVEQYQLALTTYVRGEERSLFKRHEWDASLTELLSFFYDQSRSFDFDESCDCKKPTDKPVQANGRFLVDMGAVKVQVPFSYAFPGFELHFANVRITLPQSLIGGGELLVKREWFHESTHSLISDEMPEQMMARLVPYTQLREYSRVREGHTNYGDLSNHFESMRRDSNFPLLHISDDE